MSGSLVVFAKAPRPGQVKTRLCPPLHPEQAAELYAAMLADVLAASARFAQELCLDAVLAVHPASAAPELARTAPTRFRVVAQRGPDLARRMAHAVEECAAAGAGRILLRGSDSPALGGEIVAEALSALEEADLAVSPDRDGGYSLIGLRRPVPGLFDHPMSTQSVLEDTLANAAAAGLDTRTLSPCFDVDSAEDLRGLSTLAPRVHAELCPRTHSYLEEQQLSALL